MGDLTRFDRWHWRAFLTGGGSAFWVLAYGLFYWASRLSLGTFQSAFLYMGYLFLLALFDFLVTGTSTICVLRPQPPLRSDARYNRIPRDVLGSAEVV